jgi:hypothetical protein
VIRSPSTSNAITGLCALIAAIAVLNALNRVNVITRNPAGDYRPGQYA